MKVTFIGSGDAFGSGGRLQTCILVDTPEVRFAFDFGATSLAGLRRENVDPNSIDVVILTHLHGDHCAGVPFLLLDAMLGSKRSTPLTIVGPAETEQRLAVVRDALFPGSHVMEPIFPLAYRELAPGATLTLAGMEITAAAARHTRETNPLAIRVRVADRTIAYTGDGELTDALVGLVSGVDLLIAECYFFDKAVRWHLNYPDIAHLDARRIVLTHMHADMLAHADSVPEQCAHDGLTIELP